MRHGYPRAGGQDVSAAMRNLERAVSAEERLADAQRALAKCAALVPMLATVENDPTVPAYARKVAADAVRAMEGES